MDFDIIDFPQEVLDLRKSNSVIAGTKKKFGDIL